MPIGPEQPLVASCREEIDGTPTRVEVKRPDVLNGVEIEEDVPALAELGGPHQVLAEAIGELHRAQRDQARPLINERRNVLHEDPAVAALDPLDLDPLPAEIHPAVDVRWVLDVGDNDVVAGHPVQTVGDEEHTLGRVLDERDLRAVGPDESSDLPLDDVVGVPTPVEIMAIAVIADVGEEPVHRGDHRCRGRRDRGIV